MIRFDMRNEIKIYVKAEGATRCLILTQNYTRYKKDMKTSKSKNKSEKVVEFSYGNAQKLVNMTAKYIYIATYFNDDYKDKFEKCHCPMDSLIVESLIADIKEC